MAIVILKPNKTSRPSLLNYHRKPCKMPDGLMIVIFRLRFFALKMLDHLLNPAVIAIFSVGIISPDLQNMLFVYFRDRNNLSSNQE